MSIEQNKAVVRRFITEVLSGGNVALADELLAPDYVNRFTGSDVAGFKGFLAAMHSGFPDLRLELHELVAEGDSVVARFTMEGTNTGSMMGAAPTGKKVSARGLTYYRLVNGKIVEDDPFSSPDLAQALGIPTPAAAPAGR
jgi:predicted ester cyclase